MRRFETRIEDGIFAVEGHEGWLTVGPMDAIVEDLGEVYEVEYPPEHGAMPWLETKDGTLEIPVRSTLQRISFDEKFVDHLAATPEADRLAFFTDMIASIWDRQDPDAASR